MNDEQRDKSDLAFGGLGREVRIALEALREADASSTASALRMLLPMAEAWAAHVATAEERSEREGFLRPEHHAALEHARGILKRLEAPAHGQDMPSKN